MATQKNMGESFREALQKGHNQESGSAQSQIYQYYYEKGEYPKLSSKEDV
jgi:hypothetical protein